MVTHVSMSRCTSLKSCDHDFSTHDYSRVVLTPVHTCYRAAQCSCVCISSSFGELADSAGYLHHYRRYKLYAF